MYINLQSSNTFYIVFTSSTALVHSQYIPHCFLGNTAQTKLKQFILITQIL